MLYQILVHTPTWVWGVLLLLVWMGLSQTVPRTCRLRRVIALPLVACALSLYGTFAGFGTVHAAWVMWAGAALITVIWVASSDLPAGVRYHAEQRAFSLPGSWVPLGLMMAIFLTRYVMGVVLAMQPALSQDPAVAAIVASLYGALSGVFIGRMLRFLRLAQASSKRPADAASPVAWG